METKKNWRGSWILLGGITGALLGIFTAYLIIESAGQNDIKPKFLDSANKGMQLGLGVVSLLKNFTKLSQ